MSTANDRLVWIDCEMTGLDLDVDELVEVAVVVTDFDLVPVHPGFDIVINPDRSALENMNDFVRSMHTDSGLINEIPHGVSLAEAEYQVLEYILKHVPDEGAAPLAGNTIGTDRAFLAKYMPRIDKHLHYRSVDVSSIKELCRHWFPRIYFNAPQKNGGHRALADILESIRELDYYRRAGFVAIPGPASDELKRIAERVEQNWRPRLESRSSESTAASAGAPEQDVTASKTEQTSREARTTQPAQAEQTAER
ncbi:oligoribonuclease [Curtobacterium ammoniigenes]|uniref:oligoribonuclease n=1 Tax=Curtobacterium ammoniigenes TaxID=395387 RepID=UPI0009FAFDCF|nr:oligoribonuclease [Curtobacterium ammoniigenes]